MTVEYIWINNQEYFVSGSGYESEGTILKENKSINLNENITFHKFLDSIVVNNNAKLIYEDVKVRVGDLKEIAVRKALGSPTEASLLVLSEKSGNIPYDIKKKYELLKEFSFSSEEKRMTTVVKSSDSSVFVFSKGAPERLLNLCSEIEIDNKSELFTDNAKLEIIKQINNRASQGYRTLAVAYRKLSKFDNQKREEIEDNLIFLSYVSILDPARQGVRESVVEAESGGIKIRMITGDHPATAKTIASQMRIYKQGDIVVEGSDIEKLNDEEFERASVFARVEPLDKEIIVKKYQDQNRITAMTGDGINDSLALKLANTGIAMGITGTDLAKETADLVISDDNFNSIIKGVKIGRGLFAKIRSIIYFFIATNIMEAMIFFTYEFLPFFDLFSSEWQHIYIFGIVHSLPSIALVIDKYPKDVMSEPPRDEEQLLNKNMWRMLLVQIFLMGLGLVLALELTRGGFIPLNEWNTNPNLSYIPLGSTTTELISQKSRTMFITTIYLLETTFLWTFRRPNKSIYKSLREEFSSSLFIIALFTLSLHILYIVFSYPVNYYVNEVFGMNLQINLMFLSLTDWLMCILLALPGLLGIEIYKYYSRKRNIIF